MVGAIDAVCSVAERIIGKLKEGAAAGGPPLAWSGGRQRPRNVSANACDEALCRQPRPAEGHQASAWLQDVDIDLPKISQRTRVQESRGRNYGEARPKPVSPAQLLYAKKIAQGKGVVIPEEAKANSAAMSAWIDSNRGTKRRKHGRKTAYKLAGSVAPQSTATTKRSRKRKADAAAAPPAPAQPNSVTGTPLRIPYGNKEVALKLGARYRSGGWYAPPGVDLSAFGERGWL